MKNNMINVSVMEGRADRMELIAALTEESLPSILHPLKRAFFKGRCAALKEHANVLRDDIRLALLDVNENKENDG